MLCCAVGVGCGQAGSGSDCHFCGVLEPLAVLTGLCCSGDTTQQLTSSNNTRVISRPGTITVIVTVTPAGLGDWGPPKHPISNAVCNVSRALGIHDTPHIPDQLVQWCSSHLVMPLQDWCTSKATLNMGSKGIHGLWCGWLAVMLSACPVPAKQSGVGAHCTNNFQPRRATCLAQPDICCPCAGCAWCVRWHAGSFQWAEACTRITCQTSGAQALW